MTNKSPDRIFFNGKIITVDQDFSIQSGLAICGDRILAVGTDDFVHSLATSDTERVDLKGRSVIPGLVDGHAHMDREGLRSVYPSLAGASSIADVLSRIEALVRRSKPGEWIVTMPIGDPPSYWDTPDNLDEKRWPTRWEIDEVAPDNPVYIRPIWGFWRHQLPLVSVANSMALSVCGIDRSTQPPVPSVTLEKDDRGELTGVFTENTYMSVVELTLMRPSGGFTHEDRVNTLQCSMSVYNSFGTTTVFEEHGVTGEVLSAYQTLREAGPLNVRANLLFSPSWQTVADASIGQLLGTWGCWLSGRGIGDEYLRIGGLNVYLEQEGDGPRSPHENKVRALASPYTGWAGFNYDAGLSRGRLKEVLIEAARNNIRCAGLSPDLLSLFEEVDRVAPITNQRWVLGHVSLLSKEEITRARDLGLVLTTHTNRYIWRQGAQLLDEIGSERENDISPLASIKEAGVRFCLASDNVPVSMFYPIWQAISRKSRDGDRRIAPAESIGREDALRAVTIDGAYLTFEENEKGSLEAGKLADFVCLTDDPLRVDEDNIKDLMSEFVVVGGRTVYQHTEAG